MQEVLLFLFLSVTSQRNVCFNTHMFSEVGKEEEVKCGLFTFGGSLLAGITEVISLH